MKKLKLVSIAMATYNGSEYLKEQLDSILNQTYANIEVIICDDCSTDNTFQILQDYAKKDSRIKLFKNDKNLGYVKNFEKAISLSKGDYIALSDQDDVWMKDKIEILLKEIKKYDLIHSDACLINEKNAIISESFSKFSNKMIKPLSIIDITLNGCVTGCTCMFTKKLKQYVLPFPDRLYMHDKWLGINAYYLGSIKYLDLPLIKYRQHSNNQIGVKILKINIDFFKIINIFKRVEENCKLHEGELHLIEEVLKRFSLNDKEKKLLKYAHNYFNNYINNKKIKSFLFRIRLYKYFDINKPFLEKIIDLINVLRTRCKI